MFASNYPRKLNLIPLIYPENNNSYKNVLFIDNSVENYQTFVDSVNSDTFPIVYSAGSSKTDLLALLKTKFTSIDRIAFVFVSSLESTKSFLDYKPFFVNGAGKNLTFLISIIKEFSIKNVDFLACETLNYPNWINYYAILTKETGVIVGASNDKTGNVKYGGDWVLESTHQDIELIYFTQSIAYYSYLLDTIPVWAVTQEGLQPFGVTGSNGYLYVANGFPYFDGSFNFFGTIGKISLTDPSGDNNQTWVDCSSYNPSNLIVDSSGYLYVSKWAYGTIARINLNDPSGDNITNWVVALPDTLPDPTPLAIYDGYLYATTAGVPVISKINLSDPSDNVYDWFTTGFGNFALTVDSSNGYLYVGNWGDSSSGAPSIMKINLNNPSDNNLNWFPQGYGYLDFGIYNGYLYATNYYEETIDKINLDNPIGDYNSYDISEFIREPFSCYVNGPYLYITDSFWAPIISRFDLPYNGEICFPKGTPIQTDQGIIAIHKINPKIHTINNKKIVYITKSVTKDEYLVCFKKDSLGQDYPSADTTMSKEHKLFHKGTMKEAQELINENIYKVNYNGEILYNILMEEHSKVVVNNLICETLHPDNLIAKLYRGEKPSSKEKNIAKLYKYATSSKY